MDEVGARIQQQSSIASETNNEECTKVESTSLPLDKRICLVGSVTKNTAICTAAQSFGVPVVTSDTGEEYSNDQSCSTIFVLEKFEGDNYDMLSKSRRPLLGPSALQQLANKGEKLPDYNTRPLYNLAMSGVVVCFTGFRNKDDLTKLVPLIHHMGGSIRKDMSAKVTHLIANVSGGDKYHYAATFRVPIMHLQWVLASWEYRDDIEFSASMDSFISQHRLKPFCGARFVSVGFPEEEEKHMIEVLEANGGNLTTSDDPSCTHMVMDQAETFAIEANSAPLSPKASTASLTSPSSSSINLNNPIRVSPPRNGSTPKCSLATTPYSKVNLNVTHLETVHEKSNDNCVSDLNNTFLNTTDNLQRLDLDKTSSSKRKRKLASPERFCSKRRKDLSYSETRKRKISDFFKTPFDYFSHRRRTIGGSAINQSLNLNESVISTSGAFDIHTVQNLSQIDITPNKSSAKTKKIRKNLFVRTFSSSKFRYSNAGKKSDLNSTKSSLGDFPEVEAGEKMNATCFADFSLNHPSLLDSETQIHRNRKELQGQALTHTVVVDESTIAEKIEGPPKAHIIKAEWFWTSVQKGISLEEKDYLFGDYLDHLLSPNRRDSHQATPGSASRRKRKRLRPRNAYISCAPTISSVWFLSGLHPQSS
ncbi:BRCA1 C Terminus (BRCT) domain [Popillia japonica]|uniref:BRCA1 C Terminus (BRCT) domain n=1 Tax=Popillia japonica TaxID=7064 RepID=A0AAW1J0C6_POPJA